VYLPPTQKPCITLKGAGELGTGAKITYLYKWQSGAKHEFNQVDVYCNNTGHIDRVEAGPSSNEAFSVFGEFLHNQQKKLTDFLIDKMSEPDDPQSEDEFNKQVREGFGSVAASLITDAYGVDPRKFTAFVLNALYDRQFGSKGLPTRGMDTFLLGLGETREFRQIGIDNGELPRAVQRIADISVVKSGLPDRGPWDSQMEQIKQVADSCARITAHDAFTVTVGGNHGTELLARLSPSFAVCNGSPILARPGAGSGAIRTRPLMFSVAPAGRGWRDAKGSHVQVWFQPYVSDLTFAQETLFDRYGLFVAALPQPEIPCADAPGGGTPPDRDWLQEGTRNVVFRFRFDCEHAEIYDAPSHLMLADLALQRSPGNPRKDVYKGVGPISDCPGGTGKVEISRWSPGRIEVKIEEPNSVDHVCGGFKTGHIINGLTHDDWTKATFIPKGQ